jgi:enhancing lycopene biosynthesis protein 2
MQSFTLNKELMEAYCIEIEDKKKYIGMVPLTAMNFNHIIDFYIKQQLTLDNCDISIMVKMEKEKVNQHVPHIVSEMLKHIECSMSVVLTQD